MDRLIAPNSVNLAGADLYPASGTPQYATDGNPVGPVPATQWPAYAWNMLQDEIRKVITDAGITPVGSNWGQLSAAIQALVIAGAGRTKLAAPLSLYVATTGSDSNTGAIGAPFLTIQHAINVIYQNLDLGGFQVTLNVAAGTYTGGAVFEGLPVGSAQSGSPPVVLAGTSAFISVTNGNCVIASQGAEVTVQGFTLDASGSGGNGNGLVATTGAQIIVGASMVFGSCAQSHMSVTIGGNMLCVSAYSVTGGATFHINSNSGGAVVVQGVTVTLTGTPAFSTAFAQAILCATLQFLSTVFSGSATGSRYNANFNGAISTGGAGATYLPGNSGGTTATGGQYG